MWIGWMGFFPCGSSTRQLWGILGPSLIQGGPTWQMAGKKSPALPLFRTPAGERSGSSVIMVDQRLKSQGGKILWMVYQLQDPQINGLEHLNILTVILKA